MGALLVVLACAIGGKAVAAPAWIRPALPAALGFLVMQCDQRDFCFAIACPGNKLQLVNISPGGGPFGNPDLGANGRIAKLTVGQEVFSLSFAWDDSILEQVGNAGSRSELPVAALLALARSNGRIEGTNTGAVRATITSSGLKQHWPVLAKACGLPELPR
ncbi:hypothetical protein KMZ68_08480 [Bradyrhizobium sediminis]|uniref:DUF1176 domain-containing protein n=1 Tax=Bradyrhizobium sediminis TaxID=2840469 RepID=A0A975RU68_9BRAD|nr:hypothetical protein [Bradyrhizobium sediminis]QWG19844.1 hypothetical protein KMZ68_08480 [Bradyrhizobium sediminis]